MLENQLLQIKQMKLAEKVYSTQSMPLEAKLLAKKLNIHHNSEKAYCKAILAMKRVKRMRSYYSYFPSQKWLENTKKRVDFEGNIELRRKNRRECFKRYILRDNRFLDKVLPLLWNIQLTD